ncbi:MAG TPA: hypothetical protein VM936_12805 [Pyrinomonadaceae bacterium]|jgi:hypothetical protein|nr:hypothetical protein [Pyrinomonadaceae bacterium]
MPYAKILLAAALAVAVLVALVALLKSRRGAGPMVVQNRALPHMKGSLDADKRGRGVDISVGREILELLETGRRAEVVAIMRERTGWSAEEAEASLAKLERLKERLES